MGFLGAVNYYRRSLPKYNGKSAAQILQPLYNIATTTTPKSKGSFEKRWLEEKMQIHFDEAKQLLMSACKLVHPDPNSPIALTTDASSHAIGGVLEQFTKGKMGTTRVLVERTEE